METRANTEALYTYIRELYKLKNTTVTDVRRQQWCCFYGELPKCGGYVKAAGRDELEDGMLLRVGKPAFSPCPAPPACLRGWLLDGWQSYSAPIALREPREGEEAFAASSERAAAKEEWSAARSAWAEAQRAVEATSLLFNRLFALRASLEQMSGSIELMLGSGLLRVAGRPEICHPLLLEGAKIEFDPRANMLTVVDTDTDSELYTELLQGIDGLRLDDIGTFEAELKAGQYHPVGSEAEDYLRRLTNSLSPESEFLEAGGSASAKAKLSVEAEAVLLVRRKRDGTVNAVEDILRAIGQGDEIPNVISDITGGEGGEISAEYDEPGIDIRLAEVNGENPEILLAKSANREQLEIAEKIERHNAVIVQGPPGTGKTHTIANLIGHFLAQGKSVLVTSHTPKALEVLKEKIPSEISGLCASLTDDNRSDMFRSINAILEYQSRHTAAEMKRKADAAAAERETIIRRLAETRRRLYELRRSEYVPLYTSAGEFSPAEAARAVAAGGGAQSCIPGRVDPAAALPLDGEELCRLYRTNSELTPADERELAVILPSPSLLPEADEFAALCSAVEAAREEIAALIPGAELDEAAKAVRNGSGAVMLRSAGAEDIGALAEFAEGFQPVSGWMAAAAVDGHKGGGYRERWLAMCSELEAAERISSELAAVTKTVAYPVGRPELEIEIKKLAEITAENKGVPKLKLMFDKKLKDAYDAVRVNGLPLERAEDCQIVLKFLSRDAARVSCASLWDMLMAPGGLQPFAALGAEPERTAVRAVPSVKRYLDWYATDLECAERLAKAAGVNTEAVFTPQGLQSELAAAEQLMADVARLPVCAAAAKQLLSAAAAIDALGKTAEICERSGREKSALCSALVEACTGRNAAGYAQALTKLRQVYAKRGELAFRLASLARLSDAAPDWARAIAQRKGQNGQSTPPPDYKEAWKLRQLAARLDSLDSESIERLTERAAADSAELRKVTERLTVARAWYHLLRRTEDSVAMRSALQGYAQTVKKIGKGTGRCAPELRAYAREKMAECQMAVPAWIMPVSSVLYNMSPSRNRFDVVIFDEASQSDISALAVAYMGRRLIVVGDDKQVSPLAVGVDQTKVDALRDMYLRGRIANWKLYGADDSLYDIASRTYKPLMLREHFRCMPEIIGYSNRLSYDGKIKPLRDSASCALRPSVAAVRADGSREGKKKINRGEAELVVALMAACMEQKEYDGKTFGAISLLGDEQAALIMNLISTRLPLQEVESRRVLCGNASGFQGDERNVIFLSLVDSNEGDGPLQRLSEGKLDSTRQRYNVAASRAKDQMWVVHSLNYAADLKQGDLRRDLLEYAEHPEASDWDKAAAEKETALDAEVSRRLTAAGYSFARQYAVGAYRIDFVVRCGDKRIAFECDGGAAGSDEAVRADMERQSVLERLGWKFVRLRGSELWRDPDGAMERVFAKFTEYGILPEVGLPAAPEDDGLYSRVCARARELTAEWAKDQTK